MTTVAKDWVGGQPALLVQQCGACGGRWYFRRDFCPGCGAESVSDRAAAGTGVVYSATLVTRAPSDAWRVHAPYAIVLVDLDEGVRVMAHGVPGLAIGDRVRASFETRADRLVPVFHPISPQA
jgi:uncharacterized protein